MRNEKGFTLIELVVVIIILGILAAFAVPKFVNLQAEARAATVKGLEGSLRAAAAMAYARAQATGATASITVDGQAVALSDSYPTVAAIDLMIQDLSGFTQTGADTGIFQANGAGTPASCQVVYNASNSGAFPVITATVTNCN